MEGLDAMAMQEDVINFPNYTTICNTRKTLKKLDSNGIAGKSQCKNRSDVIFLSQEKRDLSLYNCTP